MGILGGGKPKSKSDNRAWNEIETYFQPTLGYTSSAGNAIASLLGVGPPTIGQHVGQYTSGDGTTYGTGGGAGGAGGSNALGGLQQYFNSSGGQFLLNQGLDSLTNKFSAMGLSRSGAAMKGMEQFRQDLASTKLDNYLGQLNDLARIGLGSGGLMASAGQYSKGESGGGGLGSILGSVIGSVAASSRDLKDDIVTLGPWDDRGDGLEKVAFRYKWEPKGTRHIGVIAEQVKELRPWAYVANFFQGKPGVNYALLSEAA